MSQDLYDLPAGWEWTVWQQVVDVKNGKDYKAVQDDNGRYPVYGSGGIMAYASEYLCNENSVVIGRKGTINNPLFVKEKFWNIDTAFGLEAKQDQLMPLYLYYFCLSFNFITLNTSTTLPSLTKSNLLGISIPLPSLAEQTRIVEKLDAVLSRIDTAIDELQQSLKLGGCDV
jgi:type I restriction enzyme S subunit